MSIVGATLRNFRHESGLSIINLSKETGINPFIITLYEFGILLPDGKDINKFCKYYDCSETFILGIEGNPNIDNIKGDDLPQALKDIGVEQISVAAGHKLTDNEAVELVKFLQKQKQKIK